MNPVMGIVIIYAGLILLTWVSNRWLVKVRWGVVGFILIIQPVATTIYKPIDPRWVLAFVVAGVIVLLADLSRLGRQVDSPSRAGEADHISRQRIV